MSLLEYDNVVVLVTFFSCVLLCVVYFTEPWWKSYIGWNLFGKTFFIAAVLVPAVLHRMFGINPLAHWVKIYEAITFSFIPLWVIQRTILLLQAKWRDRNTTKGKEAAARRLGKHEKEEPVQ
jgi:hypothetical protein